MHANHEPPRNSGVSAGRHAGWFRDRLTGARILEVGADERASRTWRSLGGRRTRRIAVVAGVVVALGCTAVGVALSIAPADVEVSMTAATYRVGGVTLRAAADGVYAGDGALVLSRSGGNVRAGSSAIVNGQLWTGVCDFGADGLAETCRLGEGTQGVTAQDVWSDGRWRRTYSDGQRVEITASRGVPVPFPVGR
jgi:hypothetical protein